MKKADNFLATMATIDANLKGIERLEAVRRLKTAVEIECIEYRYKPDGSTIYRLDDSSYLRYTNDRIQKALAKDYGKTHSRITGTLKGKQP